MKTLISSIILILATYASFGQTGRTTPMNRSYPVIIPHPSTPYVQPIIYQLHDGIARLTDGSQLQGRFMYNKNSSFTFYQDGHSPGKSIANYKFEYLKLAGADTAATPRTDSTVFLRVKNNLFRRLTVGKVGLYDKTYSINEDKGKIGDILFTWDNDGSLRRLHNLEQANQWFYQICQQNNWPNSDVFLSKTEIIKRLAQLDPIP
ncbi:hypothetical protein EXU85_12290 [Spirosoma sp. KCTC 42546]|uniref:hypothetical protein n=1 Tax=Spirosoma sp. KCTC 42546 TaxID=2520506 RepID=UPI001157297C|nr:hypothetical protein [Spirosoma sp. KCTC 42546]QDK79338.1 hypothetical protein EXU85_12290 [Spirosoma sp. KCTC 42546]